MGRRSPGLVDHLRARFTCPVNGWRPYDAGFAAPHTTPGRRLATDLVPHDYALLVHDPNTDPQHDVIIPRGCAYPSEAAADRHPGAELRPRRARG